MNTTLKNLLAVVGVFFVSAFLFLAFLYVDAYTKSNQPKYERQFNVSAEGKITAVPDIATFNISVITEGGMDLSEIQKENTDKINTVTDFVKNKGILDKDIKTSGYSVSPRYSRGECNKETGECLEPKIVGYTINSTINTKVRDFSKIGDILSGVVNKGANSVSGPFFTIDESDNLKQQAMEEAIRKAKEKAQIIANTSGFELGKIISVSEGSGSYPVVYESKALYATGAGDLSSASPDIEPGSQDVTMNVNVSFEIK